MIRHPSLCDLASAAFASLICGSLPGSTLQIHRLW